MHVHTSPHKKYSYIIMGVELKAERCEESAAFYVVGMNEEGQKDKMAWCL